MMKVEEIIRRFAISYVIACALMFVVIWFVAFFGGTDGVTIGINDYGEKYPELIIHVIGIGMFVYTGIRRPKNPKTVSN